MLYTEILKHTYHEQCESFPHDDIEEILSCGARNNEEIYQEQVLSATVVKESIMETSEQTLKSILKEKG